MRIISMFLALFLLAAPAFAGKISGKITDEKTGESIIGATVVIKGTNTGTATDIDGHFDLTTPAGTYTLIVKYMGYQTKEIADVHVTESNIVTLNVVMSESKSTQLEEVVIRSSLKKENISALYSIQKNAATISDGISADVIKKSPDRSTGEVLKRVSGTTIQDNKFVIVRGLSDRYNIALIDNAILPSTEPNRKAFSFDIIPAAMIDNIIITKAGTPDLPGDFAGGVINILTKEAPDQNYNSISLGVGYNTISTGKTFRSGYRTGTDFLGFDDGSRKLPSGFPSTYDVQKEMSPQQSTTALNSLNNNFSIKEHTALPALTLQAALGRVYHNKSGNKLGLTAAVTYNHSENIKKDLVRQYDNFDVKDNVYNYSSNLGALLNAGYYFGGNKVVFKTLYNRIFDDNFLYREGYNNSSTSDIKYYAFDLIQKSLFKTSLEGEHQVGKGQSKLGWLLAYNNVKNDQPDQRKVSYTETIGSNEYSADVTTLGKANSRLFSKLNENILNGTVYYNIPFRLLNNKSNLKIGAFVLYRDRDFKNRYIGAVLDPLYPGDVEAIRTRPIETLFAQDAINNGAYYLNDLTGPSDEYTAQATTSAGYAMLDNKITDKLRVVWGARYESYHLDLKTGNGTKINPTWNDLLPSANFTYSLTEKSNIRASYFRSVARPELREVAPIAYYDYELNADISGNTNLVRSRIDNIDLRYEIFPKSGEIISASVFYKHFDKTIENQVNGQSSGYNITTKNYSNARNIGVEMEIRKDLGFIANNELFNNLSFYLNVAYINSVVDLGNDSANNILGKQITERQLSGQSPYVINTSLSYSALKGKLNMNVLYNRIGQRLYLVGQGLKGNVYESPRNLLDFQVSYNISKRSEFRLTVKDILNNPARFYFDQDNNGKFERQDFSSGHIDPYKDWIYQEYRPGTSFTLTYNYRF